MGTCGSKAEVVQTQKPEKLPAQQEALEPGKPQQQAKPQPEPTAASPQTIDLVAPPKPVVTETKEIQQEILPAPNTESLSTASIAPPTHVTTKIPQIMFADTSEPELVPPVERVKRTYVFKKETKGVLKIERTSKFAAFCVPTAEPVPSPNARPNMAPLSARPKTFAREPSRKVAYLRNTLKKLSMMDLEGLEDSPPASPRPSAAGASPPRTKGAKALPSSSQLLRLSSCSDILLCDVCDTRNVKGLSCSCGHFLCTQCFCTRVRDMCEQPETLKEHDFSIFCPIANCSSQPWNSYHVRKLLDGPSLQIYIDTLVSVCKNAGTISTTGGSITSPGRPGRTRSTSLNAERGAHSKHLQETADMLREQLRRLNVTPMEYIPLAEIQAELKDIFAKLNNDQPYDEARMDFLLMCMESNPVYMAEKAELARQWREETTAFTQECLQTMRGYIPAHIFEASLQSLQQEDGLSLELAKRILSKKCLWLVRMRVIDIERIHEADLMGRFNPIAQNLDIVELSAVFASVPEKFLNDPSGRKAQWRQNLELALREMDKQRQTNSLPASRARNPAYKKQKVAPFTHRKTMKIVEAERSALTNE